MANESSRTPALSAVSEGNLSLVSSPHAHFGWSTGRIMWTVCLALAPSLASALWFFGPLVLLPVAGAVVGAAGTEWLIGRINRKADTVLDGSAVLTGLLLGLVLPPGFSPVFAMLGGVVAIGLGKAVFGGLGDNIFNPALVGRAFLQASFPAHMTDWSVAVSKVDAVSAATPLGLYKFGDPSEFAGDVALQKLLIGNVGGCIGETSSLAILVGAVILIATRIAHWQIMASMVLGGLVFGGLFNALGIGPGPVFHVLSGGFLFGAVFMATDYVSSPTTPRGMWIFGAGIALLTILIRLFGGLPEGVMYSILLMNATVPLINRYTQPAIYGAKR
jgi:Na+-translocating ferredoxin:NAD+ oxidoreductase subunit D